MNLLQDRITSMVHAFGDQGRKCAVRTLAQDVGALESSLTALEAENKALRDRVSELESEAKQAREDEAWAKQNLAYVSMGEDGCWAGMYDRDASEERGLVERVDTIAEALSALRDMVEGGAR